MQCYCEIDILSATTLKRGERGQWLTYVVTAVYIVGCKARFPLTYFAAAGEFFASEKII